MTPDPTYCERIRKIVEDCLVRRAAGESLSDASVIEANPDLMPRLGEELSKLRVIREAWQMADQAQVASADGDTSQRQEQSTVRRPEGPPYIRCPNCRTEVEVQDDLPMTEISCIGCGTQLNLLDFNTEKGELESPTKVGHFQLIKRVGRGGFGTVWKAFDTELDRIVALKIPLKGQLDSSELEQFMREARTAAQLQHPNIVRVHEVGRDEDTVFIVSEFIDGVSLADRLTEQPERTTIPEAVDLCVKLATALDHAHRAGVIHRDLNRRTSYWMLTANPISPTLA